VQFYLLTSVKHDADTRLRHSLSGMFYFISVKAVTYSGLKSEKDEASCCSHIYFGISFPFLPLWQCLIFCGMMS